MALNILGCVFLLIAIMYTFNCVGRIFYKQNVPMIQILLMSVGIVGSIACFFIF